MKVKTYLTATELIMDTDGKTMIFAVREKGEPMSDLISRKAVLKHIEKIRQGAQMMDDIRRASIIMNGMDLCEEAVRNQPSAQPDHRVSFAQGQEDDLVKDSGGLVKDLVNDCISRQAAIDVMCELMHHWFGGDTKDEVREIKRELEKLPDVQPERKKGKWIDNETSYADGVRQTCTCSICGQRSVRPLGRFCRWCGADMGEDGD